MPSVHYKFKSSLDYKTLMFEGIQISVGELKKLIYENEKIGKSADFDLQITNAQTKQVYEDESAAVQRNASVIVARAPTAVQQKLPKVWDTRTEGKVNRAPTVFQPLRTASSMFPGNDLASKSDLSEEEKLKLMEHEATQDYDPSQYQRGRQSVTRGPAPQMLRCNRCGKTGEHWIRDCPLLNVRRPTGIPKDELMETTPDDPQAMLTPGGRYVVPIMDKQAHLIGKKERPPFFDEETPVVEPEPKKDIPSELMCPLCNDLLREAVVIPCCGYSFCDDCIRNSLLESEYHECPHCGEKGISPDSLVPNSQLRKAVNNFRNETGYIYARRQHISSGYSSATQPPATTANRLKINLVSAGIARANAAEQKLRAGSVGSDVTSSPGQQAAVAGTQSPDTRERDSPATGVTWSSPASSAALIMSSSSGIYTSVPSRASTFVKSTPPTSTIPAVRIVPPPTFWPPISVPNSITSVPPIHSARLPPMGSSFLPNLPPPIVGVPVVAPPIIRFPPQPHMAMPGPPGVPPVAPLSYPSPVNSFMATQPPPPGVVATRAPVFMPPRRPLTEAEFYDAKRRILESRFREKRRSPRPQDAWEEFLARKDRKRRRSSSRSSRSSSRSRSRSSGRSRRSRSRSITRSRSRSRSPSYHSHRRRHRERSRSNYSRSRARSRSRLPRSPHSRSRRYIRRVRRSPRSRSRNRDKVSPSSSKVTKWSPPRHRSGARGSSSSHRRALSTDFLASQVVPTSVTGVDKRSTLASSIGYAAASQSVLTEQSPAAQVTTVTYETSVVTTETREKVTTKEEKSVKEGKVDTPAKEERRKAKEDASATEERQKTKVDKPPKVKRLKNGKAAKESKGDEEDKPVEENALTKTDKAGQDVEEAKEIREEPTSVVQQPSPEMVKEASIPKEVPVAGDEEQVEKKKKAKKEKKKKRKHHRHKTPKKKRGEEESERKSKDSSKNATSKEKSAAKDEKSKAEKGEKSASAEKSGKSVGEEKSEKKDKRHKSHHKKDKRKSDSGSTTAQTEVPAKKKRRE